MRNARSTRTYRTPAILALLAIAAILAFATIMTVSAQSQGPDWKQPPTGLSVTAGAQPGEIDIVWDPHPQSSKTLFDYRVTWTQDGAAFQPQNRPRWNAYPTTNEITIDTNQPGAIHQVKVRARYDDGKTSKLERRHLRTGHGHAQQPRHRPAGHHRHRRDRGDPHRNDVGNHRRQRAHEHRVQSPVGPQRQWRR